MKGARIVSSLANVTVRRTLLNTCTVDLNHQTWRSLGGFEPDFHFKNMRHPYHGIDFTFDVKDLAGREPIQQFQAWFDEVLKLKVVEEPNAMALATCTKAGKPSIRMMLCKEFSTEGFKFFTNSESRKGSELLDNPYCSLMFYWEPLKRMVRIEGKAEQISAEESSRYFHSRPKDSQLGACVSKQSTVIPNRQVLDEKLKSLHEEFAECPEVPKPDYWGGFLVRPYEFEFWQGQTNRLHDRLRFRRLDEGETFNSELMMRGENDWVIERLSS